MRQNGMESWIAQQDLYDAFRRRIFMEDRVDLLFYRAKHRLDTFMVTTGCRFVKPGSNVRFGGNTSGMLFQVRVEPSDGPRDGILAMFGLAQAMPFIRIDH